MSTPKNIHAYDPMWMTLALALNDRDTITLECGNAKVAKAMRLRFYGFRRAMMEHDPTNPLIANMMQTQATITAEGHLHLERSPFGTVLRGLLEHSVVKADQTFQGNANPSQSAPLEKPVVGESSTPTHDQTILEVFTKRQQ